MNELAYIRGHYGVPANRGQRVRYSGGSEPIEGRITSGSGPYIHVKMDNGSSGDFHPTWKIEYLTTPTSGDSKV